MISTAAFMTDRGEICPKCKKVAIKLLKVDGYKGKVCRTCKKELKKSGG